jgi:hypothetical protein
MPQVALRYFAFPSSRKNKKENVGHRPNRALEISKDDLKEDRDEEFPAC